MHLIKILILRIFEAILIEKLGENHRFSIQNALIEDNGMGSAIFFLLLKDDKFHLLSRYHVLKRFSSLKFLGQF